MKNNRAFYRLLHNMPVSHNDIKMIKKLQKKFKKIDFIVIKQSKVTHKLGSSRPCSMCLNTMQILKIKNVYYTNPTGDLVMEKVSRMTSTHKSQMTLHMESKSYY